MDSVKLLLDVNYGNYDYEWSSSIEMEIVGLFFSSNVGCSGSLFGRWAKDDSLGFEVSGNSICLEKEGDYIFMSDLYSEKKEPLKLKISRQQFINLFDFWEQEVCKLKPKEVIIKRENGEFSIETKD